ncbi:phage replisome organizer N-terminal domain-containing protein [Clostridium botulinum]|uniref:phage replisome organizer N-terminal domain-containing protein n=1 Tax=Clostridium botulinum TaxID=1491 RepID=UPI001C9A2D6E|nr:phage replisome organizer N-terminal domain-containing protein [Clostridium botulinum]MBY6811427.1 phage replisome organizer N-terminal domain-containing protein [Clostridium botulinum]MBY6824822.1 phage replisome organizer N-terminal domain-containing protein [Clostridium botulinum]MBY6835240.1 phage replisome organizer N-terminal domain-containing protein [Clostridium botulinum]MBY6973753.1 phage replisome organizer N-terminal domain-containing protein [Clostridium botulinum]HBJ1651632.1 
MSERKIVKLRVDMYNDTKFKIIDTMEERDLIHYIWTRLLTLAGKVNLEGELYLSKSIPYTIETLALEFNRSAKKVEIALKAFIDLEMIELGENNVYKVRNFAKHQNIKSKKKDIDKDKLETVDNIKVVVDKSSDIDGIVNKEVIENTHDIGNVIDLDKRLGSQDNVNNKELVVKDDKKKRSDPEIKKKKNDNCSIISIWGDEVEDVEICEFTDKPPEGKLIRTFKL